MRPTSLIAAEAAGPAASWLRAHGPTWVSARIAVQHQTTAPVSLAWA